MRYQQAVCFGRRCIQFADVELCHIRDHIALHQSHAFQTYIDCALPDHGIELFAQNAALKASLGSAGYMLLLGGGILYCVGLIFYSIKIRWTHSIFHVLCVVASAMHCVCILLYVI